MLLNACLLFLVSWQPLNQSNTLYITPLRIYCLFKVCSFHYASRNKHHLSILVSWLRKIILTWNCWTSSLHNIDTEDDGHTVKQGLEMSQHMRFWYLLYCRANAHSHQSLSCSHAQSMDHVMRFPTMWYVSTNKASDQPAHARSLIRVFASRLNILSVYKLLSDHRLDFLSLKETAHACQSLHLSNCLIVGNHMSWLI